MKRILALFLFLALLVAPFAVGADNDYFYTSEGYGINGSITGICEIEKISGSDHEFNVTLDTNSTITFNTPIDILSVSDRTIKDGDIYYLFDDGEKIADGTCTVSYTAGYRNDSQDNASPEVDPENEVTYIKGNATVRFNKPGDYLLDAVIGVEDGYERLSHFERVETGEFVYYSAPTISFYITVKEPTASEDIYGVSYYDESILGVSGITRYDDSRVIMGDTTIAICSAPVTLTAAQNLMNMVISRLENINGNWTETRFLDGEGINIGDPQRNWIPGEGTTEEAIFEDPHFEYTGNMEYVDGFVPVNRGTSISLSEAGVYSVWAETQTGEVTGLTFEIGDSYAAYTNSRVLVNGKEIKFEAYNINDNNYFKLRDIAYVLTDCALGGVRFNVEWDGERNMINLLTTQDYRAVGGELKAGDGMDKAYETSSSALLKDGIGVTLRAYLINGNNYFKLRDLGKLFDFNVSWDGANNCILIDSFSTYIEP